MHPDTEQEFPLQHIVIPPGSPGVQDHSVVTIKPEQIVFPQTGVAVAVPAHVALDIATRVGSVHLCDEDGSNRRKPVRKFRPTGGHQDFEWLDPAAVEVLPHEQEPHHIPPEPEHSLLEQAPENLPETETDTVSETNPKRSRKVLGKTTDQVEPAPAEQPAEEE